ncbi:hypothetical protein Tco_0624539 [Tanacetum coccineum]|uniref:Uncharacterized protein n=1 Tax=Tanacetum coccineum TaxID=301880 RepID=A0ABQ4WEB7_9ASTR
MSYKVAAQTQESRPYGQQVVVGHPDDGSKGDGTGGGDKCAGGAVHIARRTPAEGGDSKTGGDGDGVVMARSLSTSASGGRDMEV